MPNVLVTGVSRRIGIGYAIAEGLAAAGWTVSATGWPAHDAAQPWGADPDELAPSALSGVTWRVADLAAPGVPEELVAEHVRRHGGLDAVVAAHARSSSFGLSTLSAAELDLTFAVNVRATLLLVQAAASVGVRRVVLFTTGVHQGPMPDEIPYAASKAALQGITTTLAAALARTGATVNCVNPGPTDTGYADPATAALVARRMPLAGRWGTPGDCLRLVRFLVSPDAGWITGQTIDADGGWGIRDGVPPQPNHPESQASRSER